MNKITDLYYKLIPYHLRPKNLWYRFKCWAWRRHTTVKPRTLDHMWCDRSHLLPHMIFEILSQFIEQECTPERVVWYGEHGHRIEGGKYVRDEMQELYDWWHQDYLVNYDCVFKKWHELREAHSKDAWLPVENEVKLDCLAADPDEEYSEWLHIWDSVENERKGEELLKECRASEVEYDKQLAINMKRVIDIAPYMWT